MKKLMSLVLALAMILSLAACGGKTTGTSPDSAGDSQQETPATSDGAFPEKQITIIMPWSLGGGPDTIARQVASYGEKYLGVPVIVENHTGGSGTIAMNDALQAEDDGYTMVVANGPLFSLTPSFINVNYTLDDITPLIGMRITECSSYWTSPLSLFPTTAARRPSMRWWAAMLTWLSVLPRLTAIM